MSPIPQVSDDPAVAAAHEKLTMLKVELSKNEREREALAYSRPDVSDRDRAALALLGDVALNAAASADELTAKIAALRRAIELQGQAVAQAECDAGRRIAEQVRPQYIAILKRGQKAVAALRQFLADESEFSDAMFAAGVRAGGTLPRFTVPQLDADFCDRWLSQLAAAYSI